MLTQLFVDDIASFGRSWPAHLREGQAEAQRLSDAWDQTLMALNTEGNLTGAIISVERFDYFGLTHKAYNLGESFFNHVL